MAKLFRKRFAKQTIFAITAIILLLIIAGFAFYNLTFLITNFNKAFRAETQTSPVPGFDISRFESLNLIKK